MSEQVDRERRLPEPVSGRRPSGSLPSGADAGRAAASSWLLPLVVLVVGVFMSVLDTSIVNVALPTIELELGVSTSDGQWVSTAYSLAEGVMVPVSGWLGHRFGSKKVYLVCLGGFTIASALCGAAGGLVPLVGFRILQAIPGGVIPVTCMTMLRRTVPPERLGAAVGLYGLGSSWLPPWGRRWAVCWWSTSTGGSSSSSTFRSACWAWWLPRWS
jgi:MFS family permease